MSYDEPNPAFAEAQMTTTRRRQRVNLFRKVGNEPTLARLIQPDITGIEALRMDRKLREAGLNPYEYYFGMITTAQNSEDLRNSWRLLQTVTTYGFAPNHAFIGEDQNDFLKNRFKFENDQIQLSKSAATIRNDITRKFRNLSWWKVFDQGAENELINFIRGKYIIAPDSTGVKYFLEAYLYLVLQYPDQSQLSKSLLSNVDRLTASEGNDRVIVGKNISFWEQVDGRYVGLDTNAPAAGGQPRYSEVNDKNRAEFADASLLQMQRRIAELEAEKAQYEQRQRVLIAERDGLKAKVNQLEGENAGLRQRTTRPDSAQPKSPAIRFVEGYGFTLQEIGSMPTQRRREVAKFLKVQAARGFHPNGGINRDKENLLKEINALLDPYER